MNKKKSIIVCGDRNWSDFEMIEIHLAKYSPYEYTIAHGDCRGTDKIAEAIAKRLGFDIRTYPANWNTEGKAAGPKRNERMLLSENPAFVMIFHDDIDKSRGSKNMMMQATKRKVPYKLISHHSMHIEQSQL